MVGRILARDLFAAAISPFMPFGSPSSENPARQTQRFLSTLRRSGSLRRGMSVFQLYHVPQGQKARPNSGIAPHVRSTMVIPGASNVPPGNKNFFLFFPPPSPEKKSCWRHTGILSPNTPDCGSSSWPEMVNALRGQCRFEITDQRCVAIGLELSCVNFAHERHPVGAGSFK